jgi:hypothetical protein
MCGVKNLDRRHDILSKIILYISPGFSVKRNVFQWLRYKKH